MMLAKPSSKLFDTGPRGQLPRKLGNRQGKQREELPKAMFSCGRGLHNVFFPLKKFCPGQRHCKMKLDCKTSTLWPVHLPGAGLGAPQSPRTEDSGCKSSRGACSKAIPYLFRHEAPS